MIRRKRDLRSQISAGNSNDRDRRLLSLALPWAAIVLASAVAAAYYNASSEDDEYAQQDNSVSDGFVERLLSDPEHHHKHVFEEVHPPLFPLTNRDKIGFTFAVMGLMIAAGGGIGGGGILVPIYILVMEVGNFRRS